MPSNCVLHTPKPKYACLVFAGCSIVKYIKLWRHNEVIEKKTARTETPWHLTDGHGNSTEPTGGHVWSIRGHRWEKLFRIPSMAIGGPPVENPWPLVEIDNFRSDNLVCGTFRCQKNGKKLQAIFLEILLYRIPEKQLRNQKCQNAPFLKIWMPE